MSNPDWILECRKCSHLCYITKSKLKKMLETECDNCGEEPEQNWTFIGEGNYDKEYGKK